MLEKKFLDEFFEEKTEFMENLNRLKSRMEKDARISGQKIARSRKKALQAITVIEGSRKMVESVNWKKADCGGL